LGRAYNITNGAPEPLWDVLEAALTAVGLDGRRKRLPLALAMALAKGSEVFHRWRGTKEEPEILPIKVGIAAYSMTMDISAARESLGYQPRVTTKDAIARFAAWWAAESKRT
jgi:nucleoside-diphosphate-sugar epimerase